MKEFCAPSYRRIVPESQNDVLELYTEPVSSDIVIRKAEEYCSQNVHESYTMESKNRGVFFFVNIIEFEDSDKFRNGALIDKRNLIHLFREFGYKIFYKENISLSSLHYYIDQLVQSDHLQNTESFVLCVLSHGSFQDGHQMIEFTCGKTGLISDIVGKFNNVDCSNLCGKPKVFMFPMCRGSNEGAVLLERYKNRRIPAYNVNVAAPARKLADIKICYATTKGFNAYRNVRNGSWYVTTFVNVLARHAYTFHLDDMLKIIGREIDELCAEHSYEEYQHFVQVVSSEDIGFNKHLFFNPGYYDSEQLQNDEEMLVVSKT